MQVFLLRRIKDLRLTRQFFEYTCAPGSGAHDALKFVVVVRRYTLSQRNQKAEKFLFFLKNAPPPATSKILSVFHGYSSGYSSSMDPPLFLVQWTPRVVANGGRLWTCDVTGSVILSGRYRGVTVRTREIKRKSVQGFLRLNKPQLLSSPCRRASQALPVMKRNLNRGSTLPNNARTTHPAGR